MEREPLEQLISAWLDDPQAGDVGARLEVAAARDPALARLRDQYIHLEQLLRSAGTRLPPVAWERVKAELLAAVERFEDIRSDDVLLNERLQTLPGIAAQVDWARFRRSVTAALDRAGRRRSVPWRVTVAAGFLAAAAAITLMLSWPDRRPASFGGRAVVQVLTPGASERAAYVEREVARVLVIEDADLEATLSRGDLPPAASEPELYFLLEPPRAALAITGAAGFGSG